MKNSAERSSIGFAFRLAGHGFRIYESEIAGVDGGPAQRTQEVTMNGELFGMWPFEDGESRDEMVSRVVREYRARAVTTGNGMAGTATGVGKGRKA